MMNREAFVRAQDEHLDIMIALAFDLDDAEAVQQLSETDDPPLTTDDESHHNYQHGNNDDQSLRCGCHLLLLLFAFDFGIQTHINIAHNSLPFFVFPPDHVAPAGSATYTVYFRKYLNARVLSLPSIGLFIA